MIPEIKEQWVSALREDGRRQATSVLRSQSGAQCCLDVLCELAVNAKILPEPVLHEYEDEDRYEEYDGEPVMVLADEYVYEYPDESNYTGIAVESELLPKPVWEWADLGTKNPEVFYNPEGGEDTGMYVALSELNDVHQLTFPEIANVIEQSDL